MKLWTHCFLPRNIWKALTLWKHEKKETETFSTAHKNSFFPLKSIKLKSKVGSEFAVNSRKFTELVEKKGFVDKSLFIKDVIDDDSDSILITAQGDGARH